MKSLALDLLPFLLACVLIELTPGPNMTYLAIVSAQQGRRAGFAVVAGVTTGLALVGFFSALGLGAAIDASPVLYHALRWVGAGYMLWLAVDSWRATPKTGAVATAAVPTLFRRGMMTNLLNPKAYLFYMSVVPEFVPAFAREIGQSTAAIALYVGVATAVHSLIALAGAGLRPLVETTVESRTIGRVFAILLAAVAAWIILGTRR